MNLEKKWKISLFLNVALVAISVALMAVCGVLINENIKERKLVKAQSETILYQMAAMELPRLSLIRYLRCEASGDSIELNEMLGRLENDITTVAKANLVKLKLPEEDAKEISDKLEQTAC